MRRLAGALASVLAPLVSRESHLATYLATNTLIVTDVTSNSDRLIQVITGVDVEAAEKRVAVIAVEHLAARQMAEIIRSTLEVGEQVRPRPIAQPAVSKGPGPEPHSYEVTRRCDQRIKLIPYTRTNSFIVVALPNDLATIRELTAKLDVPTT